METVVTETYSIHFNDWNLLSEKQKCQLEKAKKEGKITTKSDLINPTICIITTVNCRLVDILE